MMKKIFLFVLGFSSWTTACIDDEQIPIEEPHQYMSTAVIDGYDYALCPCCGGVFIQIDSVHSYRFYQLPPNANIDLNVDSMPIYVNLDWQDDTTVCGGGWVVDILKVEEIN